MSVPIQFKRGTRAQIDALASSGGLLVGEPLLITNESKFALALSPTTYQVYVKEETPVLFSAFHNIPQAYVADNPITNWTVEFNNGGGTYSAGAYTVPITGIYRLHITLMSNNITTTAGLRFRVNSTNRNRIAYASNPSAGYDTAAGEEFVQLTAGDLVRVIAMDTGSWFGGASPNPIGRWNIQLIRN